MGLGGNLSSFFEVFYIYLFLWGWFTDKVLKIKFITRTLIDFFEIFSHFVIIFFKDSW